MRLFSRIVVVAALMVMLPLSLLMSVQAAERATKAEAEALVKKVSAYLHANGAEKTYAEVSNRGGSFVDRDLYAVVYDLNGKCLAHGSNPKLVGKELIDIEDADGKFYVRERVALAKTKTSFWQEYKYANPVSKQIESKETFCQKDSDVLVCAGVYKQ